jgi:hypothetical protein
MSHNQTRREFITRTLAVVGGVYALERLAGCASNIPKQSEMSGAQASKQDPTVRRYKSIYEAISKSPLIDVTDHELNSLTNRLYLRVETMDSKGAYPIFEFSDRIRCLNNCRGSKDMSESEFLDYIQDQETQKKNWNPLDKEMWDSRLI